MCYEPDCEQVVVIDETSTSSDAVEVPLLHKPSVPRPTLSTFPAQPSSSETNNLTTLSKDIQSGKHQRVTPDLKFATLPTPELLRKPLIELVRENLDAFAASSTDLDKILVVVYTIRTGDERPFRHKLRAIIFARRQYIE